MRNFFLLCFLLFISFVPAELMAQKIVVNASIDSTVLWIGDQARLSFVVSQQPKQKVSMPLFSDSIISGLELVETSKRDTVISPDGHIQVTQSYVITAFEDSLLYIPPFPFVSDGDTVWSKSLSLKVVQPFKIDTASKSVADIKPVFKPPFDWAGLLKILLLGLVVIGLLIVGFLLYRRYIQNKPLFNISSPESLLPPYQLALNHLDQIKTEKPWQQGRSKEYHTELTDVIRAYIESTFAIKSMEMTSDEILEQLHGLRIEKRSSYDCLHQILQLADLVKFAKWHPAPDEHELSLINAYYFVNQTKIEETKPLEEQKTEPLEGK